MNKEDNVVKAIVEATVIGVKAGQQAYYNRCRKQVVIELKEKQKEYRWGSDAYNVLRSLETTIPNVLKEKLT